MGGTKQDRTDAGGPPPMTRTWAIQGRNGRVDLNLAPPAHASGDDATRVELLTAEFVAELGGPGCFRGASTVRVLALDLVRFHRELGGMLAGRTVNATLGSLGDEVGLTLDAADHGGARLSGFIGAGLANAVSFNDVRVDHAALVRSYAALDSLACAVMGYAVLAGGSTPGSAARAPDARVSEP